MKVRHQLLLLMIFLGVSFLLLEFLLFQKSLLVYVFATLGFYFFTLVLLYLFFVKRVKINLNKDTFVKVKHVINHNEIEKSISSSKKYDLINFQEHKTSGFKLHNRVYFNEALSKTLSYVKRHDKSAAILMIDIDMMSDAMMANAGFDNAIILDIAKQLSQALRNEDILAKLDGNVFAVLLNDIGKPKFASAVAEKLLQVITDGVEIAHQEILLKASIGISILPNDSTNLEEAIEKTHTALYRAKAMNGSQYQFYTKELDQEAHEFVKMKDALQNAIHNNELVLHYQPKFNIQKGTVIGVEVLTRWLHPTLGLLSPDKFIDIAEDSGFIIKMSDWVLREACKINKYWQSEGYEHLTVALNISKKQFFHQDFLATLAIILNETKLNPNYLELEINEETIMSDLEKSEKIMKNVAALGAQISIDHFGVGYTSMSHLKHLPINTIKIDREFIQGIPFNPNDSALTSAMISMAHYLGIHVLAEGVENSEQLQFLTEQHCDMVQGYFLSYPLPVEAVTQHFKKISDRALG